ncbi:hypothetical protein [Alkalimonas sp.]|uniref:hypothetical protein n=1 Tax=Alkalimonas sp. TaxID=1872453 RepID=UPI00263B3EE9|nr:hypothetical protein [Alkalimonas sp.]MCC5827363.1 hypothetical protein [Alkalimonas sp.]
MNQNFEQNNAEKLAQTNQTTNNPKGGNKDQKDQKGQASTLPGGDSKKPKQDQQKTSKNQ